MENHTNKTYQERFARTSDFNPNVNPIDNMLE